MSRTSRIPHPPGSRYVRLYAWEIRRFGLAGAAILGLLEFLDQGQQQEDQPLASRARIRADLEGIVGKHLIDDALRSLVACGALKRHEETTMGARNLVTRVEYGLNVKGLERLLETPEIGTPGDSRSWDSREIPKSTPVIDPNSGLSSKQEDLEKEAAASVPALGPADAAATAVNKDRKDAGRRRRGDEYVLHGVEIWTALDAEIVQKLEGKYGAERVQAVANSLSPATGHYAPYRSAVVAAFQALDATEQQEVAEAARRARVTQAQPSLDPEILQRGAQLLPPSLRARIANKACAGEAKGAE